MLEFLCGSLIGFVFNKLIGKIPNSDVEKELNKLGVQFDMSVIKDIEKDNQRIIDIISQIKHMLKIESYSHKQSKDFQLFESPYISMIKPEIEPLLNELEDKLLINQMNTRVIIKSYQTVYKSKPILVPSK